MQRLSLFALNLRNLAKKINMATYGTSNMFFFQNYLAYTWVVTQGYLQNSETHTFEASPCRALKLFQTTPVKIRDD